MGVICKPCHRFLVLEQLSQVVDNTITRNIIDSGMFHLIGQDCWNIGNPEMIE